MSLVSGLWEISQIPRMYRLGQFYDLPHVVTPSPPDENASGVMLGGLTHGSLLWSFTCDLYNVIGGQI